VTRIASRIGWMWATLLASASAHAATSFTKIADVNALGPGWISSSAFFTAPALDAGVVAFSASDNVARWGVYTGSGGALTTVVDQDTLIPGSSTLTFFVPSEPSISQGVVAFMSGDATGLGFPAVYTASGGSVTLVADQTTPDPDGSGTLVPDMGAPDIDGANVSFRGSHNLGRPAYFTSVAGALEISADESTAVPGGTYELFLYGTPALDGTQVAFRALAGQAAGIYVADGGIARVVADGNTALPGDTGNSASFFDSPAFGGGTVAFEAIGESSGGLYAEIGGLLVRVTDTGVIKGVAADGDTVAYHATEGLDAAIYVYRNGVRQRLIGSGDVLDGGTVIGFDFGRNGLDGDQLAFTVFYDDSSPAVYLATIPEPGTAMLLVAGLAWIAARRRSR